MIGCTALALSLLLLAASPAAARSPEPADSPPALGIDEILRRHVAARGGLEAIRAIESVVYSGGAYREPGYEGSGNAFMALRRPYFKRVGDPERPGGFAEGWDGAAWEWFADPGIVVRTVGEASAAMRHGNDLETRLVEPEVKGATAELLETVEVEGRPAHRILLSLMDGFATEYYLDAETYLVAAEKRTAPIHAYGEPVTRWTRVSDYREVAGVLFPFRYTETEIATGRELSSMEWGAIEANRELPDAWFAPPAFERTALAAFLEHLFRQRTDPDAVLWTYAEFRRAHPEVDTREGVEAIGFQMLKMGDAGEATVALLEANLADHPRSEEAAATLARALKSRSDLAPNPSSR